MRRAFITLALLVALATPVAAQAPKPPSGPQPTPVPDPKPIAVAALVTGSGLRVTWPPVAGTARACVLRGGQLLYCAPGPPIALLPQDSGRIVQPGTVVELRLYNAQFGVIARAEVVARWARYLPSIQRPPR